MTGRKGRIPLTHRADGDEDQPTTGCLRGGRRSRRRTHVVAGAVVSAFLLAACSSTTSSGNGGGSGGGVVIGYETGGDSALASAIHNKYFQKGLASSGNVSLKVFSSGPAALSAIASGSLDFMCVLGLPPVISAIAKGVPLRIIDAQDRYTENAGLVARNSTGITSVSGLKGKTVGIVVGSQSTFELSQYLKTAGLSLNDVNQVNMSPPQIQSAWATGQIDGGIVWSPVFNYMADHNGKVLMTDTKLPPTATSYNVCVTNSTFAKSHSSEVTAFLKALDKGASFASANPTKAASYNASINGISVDLAKTIDKGWVSPSLSQQLTSGWLGSSQADVAHAGVTQSLRNNWTVLNNAGFITSAPPSNVSQYIGWSYVNNAVKGGRQ